MKKYMFNSAYLEKNIIRGISLLNNSELTEKERKVLNDDIDRLEMFLKCSFISSKVNETSKKIESISELKESILNKMKDIYNTLGIKVFYFIYELNDANVFNNIYCIDNTLLSIEEQEEITIKNYEKNSKYFLKFAKEIFSNKPSNKIQVVNNLFYSSFCYYSDLLMHPLIVVDPNEDIFILNHEVQHGIEALNQYDISKPFLELGPIFFELLFTDEFFSEKHYLTSKTYQSRINDTNFYIKIISNYFKAIEIFSKNNFDISNEYFIKVLTETMGIKQNNLIKFLNEMNNSDDYEEYICYLLSHLKAIELRHISKSYSGDVSEILIPYIQKNKFNFNINKDSIKIYEDYVKEMNQKAKKFR